MGRDGELKRRFGIGVRRIVLKIDAEVLALREIRRRLMILIEGAGQDVDVRPKGRGAKVRAPLICGTGALIEEESLAGTGKIGSCIYIWYNRGTNPRLRRVFAALRSGLCSRGLAREKFAERA